MALRTLDRGSDFYTVDSVGRTQEMTPEGYLLCRDVPVARTGTMLYAAGELRDDTGKTLEAGPDGLVRVFRDEPEVFRLETVASLNGKPLVDDHPTEDVNPDNWEGLTVGIVLNPHRGTGVDDQMLMADFLVTKKSGIAAVRSGKREVSCGYDASYEQTEPGAALQRNIVYNHVALVEHGRCGPRCSIGDEEMPKLRQLSFKDRIMAMVRNRDEEGIAKELENVQGADDDPPPEDDGNQHIHIHIPPSAAGGPDTKDVDPPAAGAGAGGGGDPDQPEWFKSHVQQNNARFDKVEGALAQLMGAGSSDPAGTPAEQSAEGDADPAQEGVDPKELEKEPDGSPAQDQAVAEQLTDPKKEDRTDPGKSLDKKKDPTKDARAARADFQDAVAKAEIICPGVALPTYDAGAGENATCLLRRRVLAKALRTNDGAGMIVRRIMGEKPNLAGLTCDAITTSFNAVAELAGSRNNGIITGAATYDRLPGTGEKGPPTIAELNRRHREFWKDRA